MLKRGQEVKSNEGLNKESFYKLKSDESVKVVLCSVNDFVKYPTHSSFEEKIYPQSCHKVLDADADCPLCKLAVKKSDRFSFAFLDVDTLEIKFLTTSFTQGSKLMGSIREKESDIEYGTAYTLKKVGSGVTTGFELNEIAERKLTVKDKEAIKKAKEVTISDELFEQAVKPVDKNFVLGLLKDAGMDIEKHGYTYVEKDKEFDTLKDAEEIKSVEDIF